MNFEFKRNVPEPELADYKDEMFYPLLCKLPKQLALRHIQQIEDDALSDEEATDYLLNVIKQRIEIGKETVVSDPTLESFFTSHPNFLHDIETSIFSSKENMLGFGMTAKVKSAEVTASDGTPQKIAIKYVITPTEKTLSASGEHEVLREVELLTQLEKLENEEKVDTTIIRVPHPYFHHKTNTIQCYGMELVDGANLQEGLDDTMSPELKLQLQTVFANREKEAITNEVEKCLNAVHKHCLHGDMKPRNLMVDKNGTFFIIDFGQAVLNINISEKQLEQIENLREEEIKATKLAITLFLNKLLTQ